MRLEVGIDADRGDSVVCIWARGPSPELERCLESVLEHTAAQIPILVCGAPLPPVLAHSGGQPRPVRGVSGGFAAVSSGTAPADLVWLAADRVVAEGWLGRLRAGAYLGSSVASASALGNTGEHAWVSLPPELDSDAAAAAVRSNSARLRPRLGEASGHCVYIRRSALELTGPVDDLEGFSRRASGRGLRHVLADDVLVPAPDAIAEAESPGADAAAAAHGATGAERIAPLPRALRAAHRAVAPLSVALDARGLGGAGDARSLGMAELLAALSRTGGARLSVIAEADLDDSGRELLGGIEGVGVVIEPPDEAVPMFDVVHRPHPVASPAEFDSLARLGDRIVLTQPDLIAYGSPAYFPPEGWEAHRALVRGTLPGADRVVFPSTHARDEALAEGLIEPQRASVVKPGIDRIHTRGTETAPSAPPRAEAMLADRQVILVLADDRLHSNRLFAIEVLAALQRKHRWPGRLVLAGPRVAFGGTREEESRRVDADPRLREEVLDLGEVSESERRWLLGRARLVLHPAMQGEFSEVPFEAAQSDVPCLWAPGTGLGEILPDPAAWIVPWDAEATAEKAMLLLNEEWARTENVGTVRGAASALRWDTTARLLIEVYRAACDQPPNPAAALPLARRKEPSVFLAPAAAMEAVEPAVEAVVEGEGEAVPDDAAAPARRLPPDVEQAVLALIEHPRWGPTALRAMAAGRRMAERWRQRRNRR